VSLKPLANPSIVVIAVVYGVLLQIAAFAGLAGFLLGFLVTLSLARYSYVALRTMAQGRKEIPPPDPESLNPIGEIAPILHFVFATALVFFLATTPWLGGFGGGILRALCLGAWFAVWPASAALLAISQTLTAAFNPSSIKSFIGTLGPDYAQLLVVWLGLGLLIVVGPSLLAAAFGGFVGAVLAEILAVWVLIGAFGIVGATLYEHRADFDIPAARIDDDEYRRRERDKRWQATLDRAYASIRSGLASEGYRTIKELFRDENDGLEVHQWVLSRMLAWDDPSHGLQLAAKIIERQLDEGQEHAALELVMQCRHRSRDFGVTPAIAERVARYARSIGRHGIADELAPSASSPRARLQ
jgi:hypothetical protein